MMLGMIAGFRRMELRAERQAKGEKPPERISRKVAYHAVFQRGEMAAARVIAKRFGAPQK